MQQCVLLTVEIASKQLKFTAIFPRSHSDTTGTMPTTTTTLTATTTGCDRTRCIPAESMQKKKRGEMKNVIRARPTFN